MVESVQRATLRQMTLTRKLSLGGLLAYSVGVACDKATSFDFSDGRQFDEFSVGLAYLGSVQTGDVVLFNRPSWCWSPYKCLRTYLAKESNGPFAPNIGKSSGGDDKKPSKGTPPTFPFEHVGVIVRDRYSNFPYILEVSTSGRVIMTEFDARVLYSKCTDIAVRNLDVMRTADLEAKAQQFAKREMADGSESRHVWWHVQRVGDLMALIVRRMLQPSSKTSSYFTSKHSNCRVSLLGEMNKLQVQGQDVRTRISNLQEKVHARATMAALPSSSETTGSWWPSLWWLPWSSATQALTPATISEFSAPPSLSLCFGEVQPAAMSTTLTHKESQLMEKLIKRRKYIKEQIERIQLDLRELDREDALQAGQGREGAGTTSRTFLPFPDADMVARFLQYVDVLPSPLDNAGERGGAAGTTDSTASGSLDEERGRVLLPFNLPSSCEYRPFHFLETQHVMLKKGVKFGDRTDITAKGNQPPWRNVTWK